MSSQSCAAIKALADLLGESHVITDPNEVLAASLDGRGRRQGNALAVVRPANTEETAGIMKIANRFDLVVIVQGGNTSNVGGATPEPGAAEEDVRRTIVLQLTRMRSILSVDPVNNTITVEAGVVLQKIQEAASDVNRLFPLSFGAQGSCMIGGCIGTNAGGVHVLRYGMTRRMVLGLKVVLASGEILDLMRGLRKDNAGYSLKNVFIGSEGTLGIVTEAVLSMEPLPRSTVSAWVTLSGIESVDRLFSSLEEAFGPSLTAFELIGRSPLESLVTATELETPIPIEDWQVLIDVSSWRNDSDSTADSVEAVLGDLLEDETITNGVVTRSDTEREGLWHCRERIPGAVKSLGGNVKHDISVPRSRLTEFVTTTFAALEEAFPGIEPSVFGHYGDGNLHFNIGPAAVAFPVEEEIHRLVHDRVIAVNGSIAAEHGVGSLKTDELVRTKSASEIAAMKALKLAFDPDNRLNPGRVVRL